MAGISILFVNFLFWGILVLSFIGVILLVISLILVFKNKKTQSNGKKAKKIIAVIILIISLLFQIPLMITMAMGGIISELKNLDTIEIDGNVYQKDFYPSYLWVESYKKDGNPVKLGFFKYQKIFNDKFDLYQSDAMSMKLNGELYCLKKQWNEAYNYYHDSNNYYYKYGFDSYVPNIEESKTINIEFEKFDILASGSSKYDVLNWQNLVIGNSDILKLSEEQNKNGKVIWISGYTVDKLFVTSTQNLFIYQNHLYYFVGMDGNYDSRTGIDGDDVYYYSPVSDEVNEYFLNIINVE